MNGDTNNGALQRLDFCSDEIEMSDDPAGYALHAVADGEVVSHIQPVP
jgi:hypothetical protein